MMQLQQDEVSLPARALVPLLRGLKPEQQAMRQAIDQLLSWDFALSEVAARCDLCGVGVQRTEFKKERLVLS